MTPHPLRTQQLLHEFLSLSCGKIVDVVFRGELILDKSITFLAQLLKYHVARRCGGGELTITFRGIFTENMKVGLTCTSVISMLLSKRLLELFSKFLDNSRTFVSAYYVNFKTTSNSMLGPPRLVERD